MILVRVRRADRNFRWIDRKHVARKTGRERSRCRRDRVAAFPGLGGPGSYAARASEHRRETFNILTAILSRKDKDIYAFPRYVSSIRESLGDVIFKIILRSWSVARSKARFLKARNARGRDWTSFPRIGDDSIRGAIDIFLFLRPPTDGIRLAGHRFPPPASPPLPSALRRNF